MRPRYLPTRQPRNMVAEPDFIAKDGTMYDIKMVQTRQPRKRTMWWHGIIAGLIAATVIVGAIATIPAEKLGEYSTEEAEK